MLQDPNVGSVKRLNRRRSKLSKLKGLFGGSGAGAGAGAGAQPEPLQNQSRNNEVFVERAYPEGHHRPRRTSTSASDEELAALAHFDTVFIIDDSGSMNMSTSTLGGSQTHWQEVEAILAQIVGICTKFDENGVDVYFFNSCLINDDFVGRNIKNEHKVMELFKRRAEAGVRGSTPTAEALDHVVAPYLKACEQTRPGAPLPKPTNIIVMTDGEANNNRLLKRNLLNYARRLDRINAPPMQLGVQFFQVGNMEGVDNFFAYLDNALSEENNCRDIIDTKSTEEMGEGGLTPRRVLTTVLGAVNRRLDREIDMSGRV